MDPSRTLLIVVYLNIANNNWIHFPLAGIAYKDLWCEYVYDNLTYSNKVVLDSTPVLSIHSLTDSVSLENKSPIKNWSINHVKSMKYVSINDESLIAIKLVLVNNGSQVEKPVVALKSKIATLSKEFKTFVEKTIYGFSSSNTVNNFINYLLRVLEKRFGKNDKSYFGTTVIYECDWPEIPELPLGKNLMKIFILPAIIFAIMILVCTLLTKNVKSRNPVRPHIVTYVDRR